MLPCPVDLRCLHSRAHPQVVSGPRLPTSTLRHRTDAASSSDHATGVAHRLTAEVGNDVVIFHGVTSGRRHDQAPRSAIT